MRRKIILKLWGVMFLVLLCGCGSFRIPFTGGGKPDEALIRKSFSIIIQGMVEGDIQKIYDYVSAPQKRLVSLEEFARQYVRYRNDWKMMFNGASLKHIAVEENKATATIIWGTGVRGTLSEFLKEDGVWKIHVMRRPVTIMPMGG